MTTLRFDFQRSCAELALAELPGAIANIGANDDPADLKALDPERVINCDLFATDQVLNRPNSFDRLFDAARDTWPFMDREAALVVLGDILEHMTPDEMLACLREARRVSARLCVSVPEDHRDETCDERADEFPRGAVHRTIVTRPLLSRLLKRSGWIVTDWRVVEYDDGTFWGQRTMGHFVSAE